jgi:hypothetical protein
MTAITLVEELTRTLGFYALRLNDELGFVLPPWVIGWLVAGYAVWFSLKLVVEPLLVVIGGPSWPNYWWRTWRAARRGILPGQLVPFLDWCLEHGLLRVSGTAIQFRHRIFQDWLATVGVEQDVRTRGR